MLCLSYLIEMELLVDDQIFSMQKFGGISRYFVEILNRMPSDINVRNTTLLSDNFFLRHDAAKAGQSFHLPDIFKKRKIYERLNGWSRERTLRRSDFDVFHPTYFDPYFLGSLKRPYVITVHDMIYERFPHLFDKNDPTIEQKRATITRADKIIAISEYTKMDVMDIYGIPEDRIEVIYHGHSMRVDEAQPMTGLPSDYVLYVGQRYHYKNFGRFLEAFSRLHKLHPEISLVCTGRGFSRQELSEIARLGLHSAVQSRFVTDNQLAYLYKQALCFVFPSLYEGFGIPILESFAMGCPVLLSDASCFPEVAGDAALYFDPNDADAMVASMLKVVEDSALRDSMAKKGYDRLGLFSWEKTAEETAALYRTLA